MLFTRKEGGLNRETEKKALRSVDEFLEAAESRIIAIAIVIAVIWVLVVIFIYFQVPKRTDHVVSPEIKALMKYHGVQIAYEDWNGRNYFIRNGKKCELVYPERKEAKRAIQRTAAGF